ncbi:SDR family oxidoreductase [Flavobacteriaceae bacterium]|nr:SDR family oxidoreductase [Flavobacteriaceae bacterium]MDA8947900.1 SDR family oxidoreductase [Flavobacteriaceae bacterium]MDA9016342.1 SDR family oxidoreductase [Flavobacteriaceae bacterium]
MSKTLVITGASRGIGHAFVQLASAAGHRVYALSRNISSLKKTDLVHPISMDITDENALKSFANQLQKEGVKIDALVNNAGALINKPFSKTTIEDFESIYRINVFGLASLSRMLLPYINSKGHVLNISSMGGVDGSSKFPGLAAYSSSKGAVNILTELLAEEYKETGPAFNALALGAVQTEMLAQAFPGVQAPVSANEMAAYILKFALEGQQFFNGKILPVSSSTP